MQVDEAGHDELVAYVAYLARLACGQTRPDVGDPAVGEGHVGHRVEPLAGVENATPLENQIVH
jgi:hypothetical protein